MIAIITKMNNSLARFPEADENDKFEAKELLEIISGSESLKGYRSSPESRNTGRNTMATSQQSLGSISQVIGPVVDVSFETGDLPAIYTALHITNPAINDKAVWGRV